MMFSTKFSMHNRHNRPYTSVLVSLSLASLVGIGCGAATPQELTLARTAYERASRGPASEFNPAGLHSAKETLDVAEHSFSEEGDSQETKDLAYAAERRSQTAEARADQLRSMKYKDEVVARMHASDVAQVQITSAELGRTRAQLGTQGEQLKNEQKLREEAEKRASAATSALLGFATVKQEPRGLVITLSGSVLFASDKSELLPAAQRRLNDVADTLNKQDSEAKMVVEGHADSQGAAQHNQDLSQRRAESVRTYLVSHGVSPDRISAQGFGVSRPVSDNTSAEGRANNRRVEIVVQGQSGKIAN
jgi:outer membrane protein OmpA-like peptidoglycan-associated protein